jgi:histidyl-tRNA synthetase
MEKRRHLENIMRRRPRCSASARYPRPYSSIPTFTLKSGPNVVEEIYAFQDKCGREIALRPELTAPVMRFFVNELTNTRGR